MGIKLSELVEDTRRRPIRLSELIPPEPSAPEIAPEQAIVPQETGEVDPLLAYWEEQGRGEEYRAFLRRKHEQEISPKPEPFISPEGLTAAPAASTAVAPDAGSPFAQPQDLISRIIAEPPVEAGGIAELGENLAKEIVQFPIEIAKVLMPLALAGGDPTKMSPEDLAAIGRMGVGLLEFVPRMTSNLAYGTLGAMIAPAARSVGLPSPVLEKEVKRARKEIFQAPLGTVLGAVGGLKPFQPKAKRIGEAPPEVLPTRFEPLTKEQATEVGKLPPTTPKPVKPVQPVGEPAQPVEKVGSVARKPIFARVREQIVDKPIKPPIVDRAKEGWYNFRTYVDDAFDPIRRFTKEVKEKRKDELLERDDPFALATATRNASTSKANEWITTAQANFDGQVVGPALTAIFEPFKRLKKITIDGQKFLPEELAIQYSYAKHALERWKVNKDPGISKADAQYIVEKVEALPDAQTYKGFSKAFTKFSDNTLEYVIDSGGFSKEVANLFREQYQNYIPLFRSVEGGRIAVGGGGKAFADLPIPLKRAKGSKRKIFNPLSSVMIQTEKLISWADRARVNRAIGELIESTEGIAEWGEKVRIPAKAQRVKVADAVKQMEKAGIEIGDLSPEQFGEVLTFWSTHTRGIPSENIATFFDKSGKVHAYRLKPELYRAVRSVDRLIMPPWLNIATAPIRMAKKGITLGATGLRASFGWGFNLLRDPMTYWVQSQTKGAHPGQALRGTYSNVKKKLGFNYSESHRLFQQIGGEFGTFLNTELPRSLKKARRIIADNRRSKALNIIRHPFELYRNAINIPESGPRLAEFERVYRGHLEKTGDHRSAWIKALNASKDVTVNFSRLGVATQYLNQLIPFLGPNVAGLSKFARTFKNAPVRTALRGSVMTAASLGLWWLIKDDEDYKNLPHWDKYGYWHIKAGDTMYRIPRPFEWGYIYAALPEAAMNKMYLDDPDAVKEVFRTGLSITTPPMGIAGVETGLELAVNYDFFRDRNIVPYWEAKYVPAKQQYGRYTTETAKKLGETLGISPRKIDYTISGLTGGGGLDIIRMAEGTAQIAGVLPDLEPSGLPEKPFIGRFVSRDPTINAFYRYYDKTDKAYQKFKRLKGGEQEEFRIENERVIMHSIAMRKLGKTMSDLRKQIGYTKQDETLSDKEKKAHIKDIDNRIIDLAEYGLKIKGQEK